MAAATGPLESYAAFKSGLTEDQIVACKARDAHAAVLFVESHCWVADVKAHHLLLERLIAAWPKRVPNPSCRVAEWIVAP